MLIRFFLVLQLVLRLAVTAIARLAAEALGDRPLQQLLLLWRLLVLRLARGTAQATVLSWPLVAVWLCPLVA